MPYIQVEKSLYFLTSCLIDLEITLYHTTASFESLSKAYNASTAVRNASPSVGVADAFLDAGGKTLMKAWGVLATLTEAWLDNGRVVVIRGGGGHPDAVRRSWENQARVAFERANPATGPWAWHVCDTAACGKLTGGCEYPAVVMDGVEKLAFHCCAELGCDVDPVNSQTRFCAAHAYLETQCAAFIDPPAGAPASVAGAFCTAPALPGRRCCGDPEHVALEAEYGGSGSRAKVRKRLPDQSLAAYRLQRAQWCEAGVALVRMRSR